MHTKQKNHNIYRALSFLSMIFHSNKKDHLKQKIKQFRSLYNGFGLAVGRLPTMFLIEEWSNTLNKKVACEVVPLGSTIPHVLILFQV